ncbi:Hypothetical protein D9617_2g052380 [Elsinoe fawcettii]|nr:Hypothetical protein D9617_2g052380 [Elsinoe fawcettii]
MNDGDSCRAKAKHVTKSSEAPYTKKVKCDGHGHKGKKTKSAPVSGSSKTAWESYVTGTPLMGTGARPTGKGDLVVTQVTRVTSVKGGEGMPTWAATWEA